MLVFFPRCGSISSKIPLLLSKVLEIHLHMVLFQLLSFILFCPTVNDNNFN